MFGRGLAEVGDSMDGVSIGWFVCMGARVDVVPVASLALLRVAAQLHWVASGHGPTFIFLGCESFALFGMADDARLHLAITLGFGLKDLLVMGVAMVLLCHINSIIFFFNDGYGWTSVSQGLHLLICIVLSFLKISIPPRVWTYRSTSIVSSGGYNLRSQRWDHTALITHRPFLFPLHV